MVTLNVTIVWLPSPPPLSWLEAALKVLPLHLALLNNVPGRHGGPLLAECRLNS